MRHDRRPAWRMIWLAMVAVLAACGSKPTTPSNSNKITITSAGVSPKTLQIELGSRVLFVNNDARSHFMASDPHPDHLDCPAINQVGLLPAGQSRETGNFTEVRNCGFHDHDLPTVASLQGTITIK